MNLNPSKSTELKLPEDWEQGFDELKGMNLCCDCKQDHETYREFICSLLLSHEQKRNAELKEKIENDLSKVTQAYYTEFPPHLEAGGGLIGRPMSQREQLLKCEMVVLKNVLKILE